MNTEPAHLGVVGDTPTTFDWPRALTRLAVLHYLAGLVILYCGYMHHNLWLLPAGSALLLAFFRLEAFKKNIRQLQQLEEDPRAHRIALGRQLEAAQARVEKLQKEIASHGPARI